MGETRKTAWKGPVVKYTALMLLALSTVLLLLVNLSGVTSSGFLTDLWFSQYTDGQSVDGFYYKRWTLYRLCGATYDKSITACSKKVAAYPLNPASVILSFSNITSPSRYKKYIDMSKAAYALLLILVIVTFAALVTKLVVLKLPKYATIANILHMVALVFCTAAFAVTTVVHLDAVNFYNFGKLGSATQALMWTSFACLLISFILGIR